MAAHAVPQAATPAKASRKHATPAAPVLQPKLEVGPSHDRFEAEADRVAASVVSQHGPSAPPAISALPSGGASRRALQRAEARPIDQREKKPVSQVAPIESLIQSKPAGTRKRDEQKAQTKPAPKPKQEESRAQKKAAVKSKPDEAKAQKKAAVKPKSEETKAQKKPAPKSKPDEVAKKVQTKKQLGRVRPERDDPASALAQSKPLAGVLQRDNVDDDTVLETTIQSKPDAQRASAKADSAVQQEAPREEKKAAQREATSSDGFAAPSHVESAVSSLRGRGSALPSTLRQTMEPRFGRDLSGVNIHSGSQAAQLSRDIHARAFTIGQDVFFGAGQYQPTTGDGQALLAHEVTHTIQQSGGSARAQPSRIQPSRIQRIPPGPTTSATSGTPSAAGASGGALAPGAPFSNTAGSLKIENNVRIVELAALPVPMLASGRKGTQPGSTADGSKPAITNNIGAGNPWVYSGKTPRGSVTARQAWLREARTNTTTIAQKITQASNANPSNIRRGSEDIVYLRSDITSGAGQNFMLIGTVPELTATDEVLLPIWNADKRGTLFDVDHIQELQLGGKDGFPNFWLLEQATNRSSGSNIARVMAEDFTTLKNGAEVAGFFTANGIAEADKPDWSKIRSHEAQSWTVRYIGVKNVDVSGDGASWTMDDIRNGRHIENKLVALDNAEIMRRGLIYEANPDQVTATIFALAPRGGGSPIPATGGATAGGGFFRRVNFRDPNNVTTNDRMPTGSVGRGSAGADEGNQFYRGLSVGRGGFTMVTAPNPSGRGPARALLGTATAAQLQPDQQIGNIHGQPFPSSGKITAPPIDIPIFWRPEYGYGGYAGRSWINEMMGRLSIEGMSPIHLDEAGLSQDGSLFANGQIEATKALFPNLQVPIFLRGNEIGISFPIPTDRLNFGPVRVTDAAIDIGFGDHGIFLGGHAGLVIDHVGSGTITARVTRDDTILEGEFNFDLNFLDPAQARIRYSFKDDALTLTLNAGVKDNVLPGVTGGRVTATFSREAIDLTGTLNLAPPLNGSTITLGYTRETGLTIAAENIPLPVERIPGVQNASLSAQANYNPDDGNWRLSGEGTANFSVPPATGTLTIGLNGPVVTIHGTAQFQQGIAAGSLDVTATNAELDANGQPVEGRVARTFTVFGTGSASLTFGILTGTAALELTREGHVIITGTIAMPPTYEVFPRRSYNRDLLHVEPPEFPIWGFSLGGIGVGVFAFVDARLSADAFVGPGTLQNTSVSVTFDLDHPEDAVVDGSAAFVVPAGAGLTLDIGGGLRARAAVAYVQGRVGLDARLGLTAEGRADVHLHWSREEGLALNASAHAEAHPQFEVGANASVTAGVDLGLFEISDTWGPWRKQLGSFGPDMAVGVTVPIAWSERNGLDFNMENVELTYPDIDFGALMTDGFMQLV